jgi:hypothetical protein
MDDTDFIVEAKHNIEEFSFGVKALALTQVSSNVANYRCLTLEDEELEIKFVRSQGYTILNHSGSKEIFFESMQALFDVRSPGYRSAFAEKLAKAVLLSLSTSSNKKENN